jgi:hypothetical protein
VLEINLADHALAWTLGADGAWSRVRAHDDDGSTRADTHLRLQEVALERAHRARA